MMWNEPKSKYLFAFEAAVISLVGMEGLQQFPAGLRDGLWCNAHMWHGIGLDADLAAVKFVLEVVERFHPGLVTQLGPASRQRQSPSMADGASPLAGPSSSSTKVLNMSDDIRNEYLVTVKLVITVYAEQAPQLTKFADQVASAVDAKIGEADSVEVVEAAIRKG